ncbi:MAG: BatA domain-containing protein [Lentisphaeria bacterium]
MFSFTYPMFLWGLLGLAAPLLLHLLNRHRPKRLIFPTIRFLQISQLPREGRKRLRDLLLLLCRMAIFTCLVLTLARPHWQARPDSIPTNDLKQAFFLLDASASMQTHERLAQGKKLVEETLADLSGWQVGGAVYAMQQQATIPMQSGKAHIQKLLMTWIPEFTTGKPEDALAAAIAAFSPQAENKKIFLVSDFQRSDWNSKEVKIPADVQLECLPIVSPLSDNCAVSNVYCTPLGKQQLRVLVSCRNYSSLPQKRQLTIRLGSEIQNREISLVPGQTQREAFVFKAQNADGSKGTAILSKDSFSPDDSYHFWAGAPQPVKVLLLVPDESSDHTDTAALFTTKALEAEQEGIPGLFQVERLGTGALFAADLQSCQLLFLLGAAERLSTEDFQRLKDFLQAGGIVFHCPGPAPNLSWHALQEHGISSTRFSGLIGDAERHSALGLGWVAPDSVLQRIFPPGNSSDLFLFSIRKHARLEPGTDEKVLLRTLAGLPALLELEKDKGRFFSFAFGFDLSWSDFPLSQSFLPLLRELCASVIPADHGYKKITCGESLPRLTRLDGSEILPEQPIDTSQPGLAHIGEFPLQINLNPSESTLETVKTSDLRRLLYGGAEQSSATALSSSPKRRPLWQYCALALALFILLEAMLTKYADKKA